MCESFSPKCTANSDKCHKFNFSHQNRVPLEVDGKNGFDMSLERVEKSGKLLFWGFWGKICVETNTLWDATRIYVSTAGMFFNKQPEQSSRE